MALNYLVLQALLFRLGERTGRLSSRLGSGLLAPRKLCREICRGFGQFFLDSGLGFGSFFLIRGEFGRGVRLER